MESLSPDTKCSGEAIHDLEGRIHKCRKCHLWETRNQAVPGSGSFRADVVFVGEGPGAREDKSGVPFVGAAGRFLDELLKLIQLEREDIFITNIVKCRPPGNRDPLPDEVKSCLPYLRSQIKLIRPKVICTLGNWAARTLMKDPGLSISRVHGRIIPKKNYHFCLLYHPAAALYNGSLKETLREDILRVGEFLKKINLDNGR